MDTSSTSMTINRPNPALSPAGKEKSVSFSKMDNIFGNQSPDGTIKGHAQGYIVRPVGKPKIKMGNPLAKKLRYHVLGSGRDS